MHQQTIQTGSQTTGDIHTAAKRFPPTLRANHLCPRVGGVSRESLVSCWLTDFRKPLPPPGPKLLVELQLYVEGCHGLCAKHQLCPCSSSRFILFLRCSPISAKGFVLAESVLIASLKRAVSVSLGVKGERERKNKTRDCGRFRDFSGIPKVVGFEFARILTGACVSATASSD